MSSADLLRSARATGYGESSVSDAKTGGVNRSFPLNDEELMGFGEGPMSVRAQGEVKDGKFHVHRLEKDSGGNQDEDDADGVMVRTPTQVSPS